MDVSVYFFIFLVSMWSSSAVPMVEDGSEMASPAPHEEMASSTVVLTTSTDKSVSEKAPKSCVTAREADGSCVARGSCDYGTLAVDRTLYARHGNVKTCGAEEVCCPKEYIVQEAPHNAQTVNENDDAFAFDDDD